MSLLISLNCTGKQVIGNISCWRVLGALQKYQQHTSAVPSETEPFNNRHQQQSLKFKQPVFKYAASYGDKKAVRDKHGEYSYAGLLSASEKLAKVISEAVEGKKDERVVFLCPNDASHILSQWACWISGQIGKYYKC